MKNFYEILEISREATNDEIKKAFRKLAKKYHPDTNINDKTLGEKFQEINEAYSVLSDEKSRKQYDDKLFNSQHTTKQQKSYSTRRKSDNEKNNDINSTMENLNSQFEQFFGFNPNGNEVKKNFSKKNTKNPIDTSQFFNNFFKVKKK
ncbi:J domain-containing protein [Clostridium sp. ZS2-4]|uniref:J domain-containing protein n=1 Tax=Clostridium sp. ZS2-4 TaxID=2987703 RepID=UPI00227C3E4E|nr:DnaJ domain-containing protein [Clostridium sp. ZS2-4]MCY6355729.1 DnaJ domain-containing protein [Clostridium sp. ZS2-4]